MSIKKQYLKSRPACKVTFRVSKKAASSAGSIFLVGDFNEWDTQATPMNQLKSGDFTTVVELDTSEPQYQFRYFIDETKWENDADADLYIPNGIDGENSVIRV